MRKLIFSCWLVANLISCSKSNDSITPAPAPVDLNPPAAVSLLKPDNSSICLAGENSSSFSSDVLFSWQLSSNAESYDLEIKNLTNNSVSTQNVKSDRATVTLYRGVPYSWQVVSKSSKTKQTSVSPTWNFYLSGNGITQYAPFPATIIFPASGATVSASAGKVNLQWSGSDPDSPNLSYEVYLDTLQSKVEKRETTAIKTTASTASASVVSNKVYYWAIKSSDGQSSTPTMVYSFRVN
ncbi:hypothetical protein V7S76_04025 [Aquirufa sp. ROCK2-A2]